MYTNNNNEPFKYYYHGNDQSFCFDSNLILLGIQKSFLLPHSFLSDFFYCTDLVY